MSRLPTIAILAFLTACRVDGGGDGSEGEGSEGEGTDGSEGEGTEGEGEPPVDVELVRQTLVDGVLVEAPIALNLGRPVAAGPLLGRTLLLSQEVVGTTFSGALVVIDPDDGAVVARAEDMWRGGFVNRRGSAVFADVDDDGAGDVVFSSEDAIVGLIARDGGLVTTPVVPRDGEPMFQGAGFDVDDDGDVDAVFAGFNGDVFVVDVRDDALRIETRNRHAIVEPLIYCFGGFVAAADTLFANGFVCGIHSFDDPVAGPRRVFPVDATLTADDARFMGGDTSVSAAFAARGAEGDDLLLRSTPSDDEDDANDQTSVGARVDGDGFVLDVKDSVVYAVADLDGDGAASYVFDDPEGAVVVLDVDGHDELLVVRRGR